jgi:hypothetical protein
MIAEKCERDRHITVKPVIAVWKIRQSCTRLHACRGTATLERLEINSCCVSNLIVAFLDLAVG